MNIAQSNALARLVDDRVLQLAEGVDPARLFGVRTRGTARVVLVPFWSGVAREIPSWLRPPDDCCTIALETGGWSAPMDDAFVGRPSQHPERRRMHSTVLVYGDGVDVTVLRHDDGEPQLLRGGVGVVRELLVSCWARRRPAVRSERADPAPSG